MKNIRVILALVIMVAIPIVIAGCNKATGGGWITTPAGKATFGIQTQCSNIGYPVGQVPPDLYVGKLTGQFQYKDKNVDVTFHGDLDVIPFEFDSILTSCEVIDDYFATEGLPNVFLSAGTYTPQPKTLGEGGIVEVAVVDANQVGVSCDGGDGIIVGLVGGVYDGYYVEACLEGGNIVVHGE